MNVKPILVCVCLSCGLLTNATGQSRSSRSQSTVSKPQSATSGSDDLSKQIEVRNDRFSGVKTVTLKPQVLIDSPRQRLEMEVETKVGGKRASLLPETSDTVIMKFTSLSNGDVDLGDKELHFLVDGQPIKGGESSGGTPSRIEGANPRFRIRERLVNGVSIAQLQRIARGRHVEMRLGSIELTLDEKLMKQIRMFASELPRD